MNKIINLWQRLIDIPSTDPDDARRRRLLNIILLGLGGSTFVALLVMTIFRVAEAAEQAGITTQVYLITVAALGIIMLIFIIGRYWPTQLVSITFLLALIVLLLFSDTPDELIGGRSAIYFVLPIIMASMLLNPAASFLLAGIIVFLHTLTAINIGQLPNLLIILIYFAVALISWLAAYTLEKALKDLRTANQELDQRVIDRTHQLQEAMLREQAEASQSRAILQSIADGVLVLDRDGRLIVANPALGTLIGKALPEMIGQPTSALFSAVVAAPQQEMVQALFQDQTAPASAQIDIGHKVLSLSLSPVIQESGQVDGAVAVLHDVTHEVEVSRMKSAFVAMVSHELRTPLNAIFGMVEILQQNLYGSLNEKQQDVVRRLMANTLKLIVLGKDLLDHTKIEAGMLSIQEVSFSPVELMTGLKEGAAGSASAKDLRLITEIAPEVPAVLFGDPQRLNQVLSNLVTNAIKFTDKGGVRIRFYRPDPAHYALEVSDTGAGIPPEAQEAIFEPFWQVDSTIGRKGGVGLGLSIVQRLVQLMNGNIYLKSKVSEGSIFTVVLPLRLPPDLQQEK
jgi:PAS domain S-box-containing protein